MLERRLIAVEGVVQGVGFRPYVHRLAAANALLGQVRNDASGVLIDVQGEATGVGEFCRLLPLSPPPLATIARLRTERAPLAAYDAFRIAPSATRGERASAALVPPDAATCDACLAELFDPKNRRFGHPFITCTECGPRFTVVDDAPYDRERTTMSAFPLCTDCRREYDEPSDRRFHAEAIACARCGPVLGARAPNGDAMPGHDTAFDAATAALRGGRIVAIKALGGFHLACDATDRDAVTRLRARKHRPTKPFALMVRDAAAAALLCTMSDAELAALTSQARPVVLARRRDAAGVIDVIAPGSDMLGVMLPSTPLHHLLLAALDGPLVMTSGNRSGEPVAIDDARAFAELADIADLFLVHDRPIAARCDDSVVRVIAGKVRLLRRARGYVPGVVRLPFPFVAPVLAVGGHLKNSICVANGAAAHLSAHVGDLDSAAGREGMRFAIERTLRLAGARPQAIAHDLHPDYGSTRVAEALAAEWSIAQRVPVQHHHAHIAACLAEHGERGAVIGVVFDGAGLGTDGAIWGGEFLVVHGARFTRHGHLAYVPLPGGDAAARHPWRSLAAHFSRLAIGPDALEAFRPLTVGPEEWQLVQRLAAHPDRAPRTSSIGRLFDAIASLLGVCHRTSFEGEAAMALEALAGGRQIRGYPVTLSSATVWTADPAAIVAQAAADLARGRDRTDIAAAFHAALRDLVVLGCQRIREETGLATVVLSGGVFANALLTDTVSRALADRRFEVLVPSLAPCNDGGLSLGQAYIAGCAMREDLCA